jgi:hypothetical protein
MRHPPAALAALLTAIVTALPAAACARPHAGPARSGPWSVEIVDQHGRVLPTFTHDGRTYVLGTRGDRYQVRVRNGSWRRVEAVVSVDGRDVLDGEPSALGKRGYLVEARGEVTIDGFRLSDAAVAAFRFSSVARSYAAQMGDARDVGVIGVAVFPEREPPPRPRLSEWWRGGDQGRRGGAEAESLGSGEAAPAPARPEARAEAKSGAEGAPAAAEDRSAARRPGLGTEFGEQRESWVREVPFERASARPDALLTVRYDDRRGLLALGVDVDGRLAASDAWLRETADPFRRDGRHAVPPPGWRP